jgi:4-hydroxy-tetrahydrodipicolinate synthase
VSGVPDRPYRVAVCTITPFDQNGGLDEAGIEHLVESIAAAGVSLCIGTASPGEGFALSLDDTERFFDIVVRTNAGRVPVCAMGVEPRNDGQLAPIVRLAEQAKLDTMQLYTLDPGHAMKLTDDELERFFSTLLDDMTIPATISTHVYNGLVPLNVLGRLLDNYPNISAIHCTSEVNYLLQLLDLVDGRCEVLVGGPMQALSVHALGGQGFLCSEGSIAPVLCGELQHALRSGDLAAAERFYRQMIGVFSLNIWPGGTVRFLKTAMQILGLPGGFTRPPFAHLDDAATASLIPRMRALELPEWQGRIPAS